MKELHIHINGRARCYEQAYDADLYNKLKINSNNEFLSYRLIDTFDRITNLSLKTPIPCCLARGGKHIKRQNKIASAQNNNSNNVVDRM